MTTREKIRQAYDSFTPDEAARRRMGKKIAAAAAHCPEEGRAIQKPERRSPWKQVAAAAAAVCLCAGTLWGVARMGGEPAAYHQETLRETDPIPGGKSYLQRIYETPEYRGAEAWNAYLSEQTPESETENMPGFRTWDGAGIWFQSRYELEYSAQNLTMTQALMDILAENDLATHGAYQPGDPAELAREEGLSRLLREGTSGLTISDYTLASGGCLSVYLRTEKDDSVWVHWIPAGILDMEILMAENLAQSCPEHWADTDSYGNPRLLMLGQLHSGILVRGNSGLAIVGVEAPEMTREALKAIADSLDVTVLARDYGGNALGELQGMIVGKLYTADVPQGSDMISLAGRGSSKEFRGAMDWLAFESQYDRDGKILESVGNSPTGLPDTYSAYNCYTREMADKVDEICKQYDLLPLENLQPIGSLPKAQRLLTPGSSGCSNRMVSGYVYDGGTFQLDGEIQLEDGRRFDYQMRNAAQGYLDPVTLNIGLVLGYRSNLKVEDYTGSADKPAVTAFEAYLTWDNVYTRLAVGNDQGFLFYDTGKGMVTVHLWGDGMTMETMENLANCFSLSLAEVFG